jgi:O-antigen ligase
MADREIMTLHLLFMFQFASCFVVFQLAYTFATLVDKERSVVDVLLTINSLVLAYCVIQLTLGEGEQFVPFGIEEFAFNENRLGSDPRLVGPFGNPGSTAGYFALMAMLCAVELVFAIGGRRMLVQLLAGGNLLGLVATANRAAFLVLLGAFLGLLFLFRHDLGTRRTLKYLFGGTAVLAIAATIAIAFTDFNRLFERMETVTETEGGIPMTRQGGWPVAIEKIKQRPWFGEGPYYWTAEDAEQIGQLRTEFEELGELETAYDPYPHSLYLYLLRTVGIFGLIAVIGFFLRIWFVLRHSLRYGSAARYPSGIVRAGLVMIPAFLVAQVTLEFSRPATMDYAQFIFALMGLLVGVSDRLKYVHDVPNSVGVIDRSSDREPGGVQSLAR